MGKMDEMILAVDRHWLFDNGALAFQGVVKKPRIIQEFMRRFKKYKEVRRGDAETDMTLKQMIPYAIVRRGDEVFLYRRLEAGGEARLHDSLSIGVGGHMNRINDIQNWNDNLMINAHRELTEELNINGNFELEPKVIGILNDETNEVGVYHICILMVIDLPPHAEVSVRETDKLEGYWIRTRDLMKSPLYDGLENWSKICAELLQQKQSL